MSSADIAFLIRALGFLTGIALYALLAVMAWQGRGTGAVGTWRTAAPSWSRHGVLLLAIAVLGLVLSISASALHFAVLMQGGPRPRDLWTWGLVGGYAVLMGLIAVHMWQLTAMQRVLSLLAILIFAASAAHLIYASGHAEPLSVELIVHNASLPLVAALLYQEYRFALADVFLKRALAFILLVSIASTLYVVAQGTDPRIMLALWIATALAYPALRWAVYLGVDRFILRRATGREVRARLAAVIAAGRTPEVVLDQACMTLRQALTASWVTWHEQGAVGAVAPPGDLPGMHIIVPVTEPPQYVIDIGPLASGRRLLSGDMEVIEGSAIDIARRIDAIRMTDERVDRAAHEAEARRLVAEAELRALHAQLNPHFLFNALTTIGSLIREAPDRA